MRPSDIAGSIIFGGILSGLCALMIWKLGWLGLGVMAAEATVAYLFSVVVQDDWNPKNWDFSRYD